MTALPSLELVRPVRLDAPRGRVVIVDDEAHIAEVLADIAKDAGFLAIATSDAGRVVSLCRDVAVDLAVVDLQMAGVDGLELLRRLSTLPAPPAVVLMSGADEAVLDTARHYAASLGLVTRDVLMKPFALATFESALEPPATEPRRSVVRIVARRAIELPETSLADRVVPYLQPQIALADGRLVGFEALARFVADDGTLAGPDAFFPTVRRDGRMRELTMAMIDATLACHARLRDTTGVLTASVNVPADVIASPRFVDDLAKSIEQHGMSPLELTIEITEEEAVRDDRETLAALVRLRLLGVGLAIDDFGTGHSTLSQTGRVPATEVKLDRSFIAAITSSRRARTIVSSVCRMGRDLGMRVVAEGIETLEDVDTLVAMGCTVGQGYAFGKPMPADDLAAWAMARAPRAGSSSAVVEIAGRRERVRS